jgi:hypothetical protein
MSTFKVTAFGLKSSPDEAYHAMSLPVSELPPLEAGDEAEVRRFGLDVERHRRGIALRLLAKSREQAQGTSLGAVLESMFNDVNPQARLDALILNSRPEGWRVEFELPEVGRQAFVVEQEAVEGLVNGTASQDQLNIFREHLRRELSGAPELRAAS